MKPTTYALLEGFVLETCTIARTTHSMLTACWAWR